MAKLKALLLTEGYHGMISQVEGLAKALNTEFQHKIVRLNWPWNYAPSKFIPVSKIILKDKNYISEKDNFDLIISCGRKSVVPSIILKRKNSKIFTIHIQNPKVKSKNFDFIIAPEHDNLAGSNVINSKGAIHYITENEIKNAKSYLNDKIQSEKVISLILGGPNKYYNFSNEELLKIFSVIKEKFIFNGYKAIIVPSMRTPKRIIDLATKEFSNNSLIINTVDKQAYLSSMALAKHIVVTCDSISMISEAAASGKPIFIAHMIPTKNNYRFKKFFQLFKNLGITKNLEEKIDNWKYEKFNEAERIAKLINDKVKK